MSNSFMSHVFGQSTPNLNQEEEFNQGPHPSSSQLRSGKVYKDLPIVTQPQSPWAPSNSGGAGICISDIEDTGNTQVARTLNLPDTNNTTDTDLEILNTPQVSGLEHPESQPQSEVSVESSRSSTPVSTDMDEPTKEELAAQLQDVQGQLTNARRQIADRQQALEDKERWEERLALQTGTALGNTLTHSKAEEKEIKRIKCCDGTDESELLVWMRDLKLVNAEHQRAVIEATSRGPLLKFVRAETSDDDFNTTITKVRAEFLGPSFEMHARRSLKDLTQRPNESITAYNREYEYAVNNAYPQIGDRQQRDLLMQYLESLHNRAVAQEVLKDLPNTLEEAMDTAKAVDATLGLLPKKRSKVSTLAEDSEDNPGVAAAVAKLTKELPKMAAKAGEEAAKKAVTALAAAQQQQSPPVSFAPTQWKPRSSQQGGRQYDHQKGRYFDSRPSWQNDRRYDGPCFRCKRPGHKAQQCTAPAPNKPCTWCRKGNHWSYDCRIRKAGQPRITGTSKSSN